MKLHKLLFYLFIFLLPTQFSLHLWPNWALVFGIRIDYLSPTIYFTDIVGGLMLLSWLPYLPKIKLSKKIILFGLAFLILILVNILGSISPPLSFYKSLKLVYLIGIGVFFAKNYQWIKRALFWPMTFALLYTAVLGIAQVIISKNVGGLLYFIGERNFNILTPGIALAHLPGLTFLRPYATLPHPNAFAGFILIGTILLFWSRPKQKYLPLFTLLFVFAILFSFSQAVWIALAIVAILARLPKKIVSISVQKLLYICAIISLLLPVIANRLVLLSLPKSISDRVFLSQVSGEVISRQPLLGIGLGGFIPSSASLLRFQSLFQPVHNIWLLTFAEVGIVGLILMLFLFTRAASTASKHLLLAVCTILITGFVDHYWLTLNQLQLLLCITLALCLTSATISSHK